TDAGFDIGVQVQRDVVFAGLTDGAVGQAHFALGYRYAGRGQGGGDVGGADGTEQHAYIAGDGGDGDFQLVQLSGAGFGSCLLLGSSLLQLGARGFERSDVLGGCRGGLGLRQQVVAVVASPSLDLVAHGAVVGNFFQQDDFHLSL